MHRLDVLATASEAISGDRDAQYGPPLQNMSDTAELMTTILRRRGKLVAPLTAYDAALLLVAVKLARASYKPKDDNAIDGAGYLAIAAEVSDGE